MKYLILFLFLLNSVIAVNAQSSKRKSKDLNDDLKIDISKVAKDKEILDPDTLRFQFHAQKTGISIDTNSNLGLYYQTYNWLGTRYRFGGTSKKGIDCSGFTRMIYQSVYQIELARDSRSMYKMVSPILKSDLREGDLVFFNISRGQISHVGVYLGNHKFVHASTQRGVIISDLREGYYKRYFYRGGRLILPTEAIPKETKIENTEIKKAP